MHVKNLDVLPSANQETRLSLKKHMDRAKYLRKLVSLRERENKERRIVF